MGFDDAGMIGGVRGFESVENRLRLEGRSNEGEGELDVGVEAPGELEAEAAARCINLKRISVSDNRRG